jgi:CelD/BcsL family acetyltransferase involved in cellulose biosynthesis
LRHFGEGRKLRILLINDNNEIVAIAPLMWSKYRFLHFGKITKIEFIGSPQSDYNNFILTKREMECLKLFMNYLYEHNDSDCLELSDISESAMSVNLLRKMPSEELLGDRLKERVTLVCPYMNLPDSTEIFMSRLSGNMRRNLRRRMRRLSENYQVEVKTHSDFDSIEEAMNAFYKLHQKRWETQGFPGVFSEKKLRDFHHDVARHFAEKGWLGLYFLAANDEPIATIYSFDYKLKTYEYLTGFDPEYSRYGVVNLLRRHITEECIRRGLKEYDLMRGDEPYKNSWNTNNRKNLELRLVRKGLFARIYDWATKSNTVLPLTQKFGISLDLKR